MIQLQTVQETRGHLHDVLDDDVGGLLTDHVHRRRDEHPARERGKQVSA